MIPLIQTRASTLDGTLRPRTERQRLRDSIKFYHVFTEDEVEINDHNVYIPSILKNIVHADRDSFSIFEPEPTTKRKRGRPRKLQGNTNGLIMMRNGGIGRVDNAQPTLPPTPAPPPPKKKRMNPVAYDNSNLRRSTRIKRKPSKLMKNNSSSIASENEESLKVELVLESGENDGVDDHVDDESEDCKIESDKQQLIHKRIQKLEKTGKGGLETAKDKSLAVVANFKRSISYINQFDDIIDHHNLILSSSTPQYNNPIIEILDSSSDDNEGFFEDTNVNNCFNIEDVEENDENYNENKENMPEDSDIEVIETYNRQGMVVDINYNKTNLPKYNDSFTNIIVDNELLRQCNMCSISYKSLRLFNQHYEKVHSNK